MSLAERAGLAVLHRLDPERAHDLSLKALRTGLLPLPGPVTSPRLATPLAGLALPNPVGLAAGYDKNAAALSPLMRAGFGFLEVGAATPRPQPGNPYPRLFRLAADRAVINRFGFNNDGADPIAARLAARPPGIPVGLNLGANKDSADRAADFASVLRKAGPVADFVTVNVSSPNTERLRDLQGAEALAALLAGVLAARAEAGLALPVFLKVAPDLSPGEIDEIAYTVRHGIRNEQSLDAHWSEMTAFEGILSDEEIDQVVNHVLAISNQEHDAALAEDGELVFLDNCAACHGDNGEGMHDLGAPTLNDAIWLYGGDAETIEETVRYSRFGVMPAWSEEYRGAAGLTDAEINAVAAYVHQLGGGE